MKAVREKPVRELDVRRIAYTVFQGAQGGKNKQGTVALLTSPIEGEGVSYVSRLLCQQLAGDQVGRAIYCTLADLACSPLELELDTLYLLTDSRFWTLSGSDRAAQSAWEFNPAIREARIAALRRRFDYVVLDCPAVSHSSDISSVASLVDAVLLVIGAGSSTKRQIAYAQQVIAECGGLLRGCVLNRRTYPIPEAIYGLLAGGSR
jgi:hypothetical protein